MPTVTKPSKRDVALGLARIAGYHGDGSAFHRAYVENRVSYAAMKAAWHEGARAKLSGASCGCYSCREAGGIMATCYAIQTNSAPCSRRVVGLVRSVGGSVPACRRHKNEYDAGKRVGSSFAYAPKNARYCYRVATKDGYTFHDADPHPSAVGVEIVALDRKTGAIMEETF